jgi:hypothetical protein
MTRDEEITKQIRDYELQINEIKSKMYELTNERQDIRITQYKDLIGKCFKDKKGRYFMFLSPPDAEWSMMGGRHYDWNKVPAYVLYAKEDISIKYDYGALVIEDIFIPHIFTNGSPYEACKKEFIEIAPGEFYNKINEVVSEIMWHAREGKE